MEEKELLEYLRESNKGEKSLWKYHILISPESREKLKRIWDNYNISVKKGRPDFNDMLNGIHQKIGSSKDSAPKKRFYIQSISVFNRIAVILFIPLLLSLFFLMFSPKQKDKNELAMLEVKTLPGTITQLTLSDSTHVWLNHSTVFRYPSHFKGKGRHVFLDGEAYFEVKSDKDHPFIVNNPMMKTVVTGTKFNVYAFTKKGIFEASLLEGRVILENAEQKLVMTPGSMARYTVASKSLTCLEKSVDISKSWINGELRFEDETLENVIYKLGDWYNVDFIIKDEKLNDMLLTAKIKSENLNQFLENMKKVLLINYSIEENDKLERKRIYLAGTR